MAKSHSDTTHAPQRHNRSETEDTISETSDAAIDISVSLPRGKTSDAVASGVVKRASFNQLRDGIWTRSLLIANRFRVVRTIDIAACCFPERGFKAALTAAQRAVRGLVKAGFLNRYRTDRFMTVYGLTKKGADFLEDQGYEAASSVRRVSDMTNPEHRLWAQFWVLSCAARGLKALTEQELLTNLKRIAPNGKKAPSGLLSVEANQHRRKTGLNLVPDAIAYDGDPTKTVWLEVDRSKRGAARESSLAALCMSVGRQLNDGSTLRTVVIFCRTERIQKRALAIVNRLAQEENGKVLIDGRRHFVELQPGTYEVVGFKKMDLSDGRTVSGDGPLGYIVIQMLPIWLPKVRIDSTNTHSTAGWFNENYLPYTRPSLHGSWKTPTSPLLKPIGIPGAPD